MRKLVLAFGVAAIAAALGGVAVTAQTASVKAPAAASMSKGPKAMSATGKIVGFDDASKTLTLSTSKGDEKFVLGSGARLQEGAKTITTQSLSSLAGHQAKVRYTASGGEMTAESVMVSGGARAKSGK